MLIPSRAVLLLVVFTTLFIAGCSTIHSKMLAAESQQGHIYSGVTMDALAIRCLWTLPATAKEEEGVSYFASVPVSILGTAYFLIDMPFSIVGDTLWLPGDYASDPTHERWTYSKFCRSKPAGEAK